MLGNFLEFSIAADPIEPAMQFYLSLGFQELVTADFVSDPYAAFWDGSASVGLHARGPVEPVLTFVRPELRRHLPALRRFGITPDEQALDDDSFHRASFSDACGQRVALVEARTFSPSMRAPSSVSTCGQLLEYTLPTHSVRDSSDFWCRLGFTVVADADEPHSWIRLAGHGLVVGFHQASLRPGLSYRLENLDARCEYLAARGFELERGAPMAIRRELGASLAHSHGSMIYLLASQDE